MISTNPFAELSLTFPSFLMQLFVILMIVLVIIGTVMDIIHKKNVKYFFQNAKKAKRQAKRVLEYKEKTSIIFENCKKDHTRAKVEVMISANTNKSAWMMRYQGKASAETSTLKKNQNQYPPRQVINAPKCHKTGQ